jgi:uncharacterized protein (DUF952 family)
MLLHICTEREWKNCENLSGYVPEQFTRENFVHCCQPDQLTGVLDRYFKGKTDLWMLTIDKNLLTSPVKFEIGPNGDTFPHVYGPINKNAIIKTEKLR